LLLYRAFNSAESISLDLSNIRIVLVNTSHPGNIGAAARAMKNMGLENLYLVAPRDFPSGVAIGRASSALNVLDKAVVTETLAEAVADCSLVIGTSARSRRIPWPMVDPVECAEKLTTEMLSNKVALVFGREDRGMSNEELQLCHFHVQIPTNDEYSSLNLAAAVMVLCYEIHKTALANADAGESKPIEQEFKILEEDWDVELSTAGELEYFLQHLQKVMTRVGFHDPDNPRQLLPRLRRLYSRIRPDKMEINILHGILSKTEQALDNREE
jgi:tRNA (cytidine32/uridine32-2'-O)-methyltransferase